MAATHFTSQALSQCSCAPRLFCERHESGRKVDRRACQGPSARIRGWPSISNLQAGPWRHCRRRAGRELHALWIQEKFIRPDGRKDCGPSFKVIVLDAILKHLYAHGIHLTLACLDKGGFLAFVFVFCFCVEFVFVPTVPAGLAVRNGPTLRTILSTS